MEKDDYSSLVSEGTIILSESELPFSPEQWNKLSVIFDNLDYENVMIGDTYESTSLKVFRVKRENNNKIFHQELMSIADCPSIRACISKISNMHNYIIDRCQCHVYEAGDYLSRHQDDESCKDYKYALILILNEEYEGGEFCVYKDKNSTFEYRPQKKSLLITHCNLPHEVKKITKGIRQVITAFLKLSDTN